MRINVYSEEMHFRGTAIVKKIAADTGLEFIGLRVWLRSPEELHHGIDDDDTSAVTFWFSNARDVEVFADSLRDVAYSVENT